MIVAITGGTGFIGQRLVARHLETGDSVRVLTRHPLTRLHLPNSVKLYQSDLAAGMDKLKAFVDQADILYHCAGEINNPSLMAAVHIQGTRNLLEAASGRIGRWVQLSSVGVYGPQKEGSITEDSPLNPQGPYEVTKKESDRLVLESLANNHINFSILRPSNIYGPGMTKGYLKQLISIIDKGLFFFIGPQGSSANYIHVDNVCHALIQCGQQPQAEGRIYNLSDHRTLETFVQIICQTLGKSVPQLRIPEKPVRWIANCIGFIPGMPLTTSRINALVNRSIYCNNRIETELGYSHIVTMEEGVRNLTQEYLQNLGNNK